jgi:hypothetical protein
MGNLTKIQQIDQILCDAPEEVWLHVSKLLHTHSQVTGIKIDCCTVNSSFIAYKGDGVDSIKKEMVEEKPKVSEHVWIPISAFPIVKPKAVDPISQKLVNKGLIKYKWATTTHDATVVKCNKLGLVVMDVGVMYEKTIAYGKVTHVSSSASQFLPHLLAQKVKDVAEKIKKSEPEQIEI